MAHTSQKTNFDRERIVGWEMEYSPTFIMPGEDGKPKREHVEPNELVDAIIGTDASCVAGFTKSGFRVYQDGNMTEVATAETHPDSVGMLQLVSEQMVIDGLEKIIDYMSNDEGPSIDGYLLPLRASSEYKTAGFHENYERFSTGKSTRTPGLPFLLVYAATLGCWTGQGILSGSGSFVTTQKVGMSNRGTDRHISIKSVVDEYGSPLPGTDRYEFRYNNYPTLPWQLRYRAPYSSAVIRAFEMGDVKQLETKFWDGYIQADIAYETAYEPYTETKSLDGKSAIQWQLSVAERVLALAQKNGFPDYETEAAQEVAEVLQDLEDEKLDAVALKVPWVLKAKKMERGIFGNDVMTRALPLADVPRAQQICLALDSRGKGGALEKIRNKAGGYSVADVEEAKSGTSHKLPIAVERGRKIAEATANPNMFAPYNRFYGRWLSSRLQPCD